MHTKAYILIFLHLILIFYNFKAVQHQRPPRSLQIKRDSSSQPLVTASPVASKQPAYSASSSQAAATVSQPVNFYSPRFSPYNMDAAAFKTQRPKDHHQLEQSLPKLPPPIPPAQLPSPVWNAAASTTSSPFGSEFFINNQYAMAAMAAASLQQQQQHQQATTPVSDMLFPITSLCASLKSQIAAANAFKNLHHTQQQLQNDSQNFSNNTSSSANCSSVSSGYSSTCDEINSNGNNNNNVFLDLKSSNKSGLSTSSVQVKEESSEPNEFEDEESIDLGNNSSENNSKQKSSTTSNNSSSSKNNNNINSNNSASLAHIMNWIKSTPSSSSESLAELSTKIFYAAMRWAKTQGNLQALPVMDQSLIVNDNLNELFLLQMAETKTISNESKNFEDI